MHNVFSFISLSHWISYPKLFVPEQTGHGEGEEESDIFAIREVSFQPEGDADWKETSYTLNTDSLDWVSRVTFISTALHTLQNVSMQLHSDKQEKKS